MVDMIFQLENSKELAEKLLELRNKLNKVVRYKTARQKSVVFLHATTEQSEKEIKKANSFITVSKVKYS